MTVWADLVGDPWATPGGADDAIDGWVPAWVVRPGSIVELQAVVRAAAGDGLAIVASGLGAHLGLGAPPRRLDVVVRCDRLARIVDHQAADMTVTVEAGCPLTMLAATLAGARQWLPLDPPRPERTTIGGVLAANLAGPLRASQGTARDLLLGLRTVSADGTVIAGGGRVVKNVAGYDLPKMHVGALGTLGVIVEATFKVRPRPACEAAVVLACRTAGAAADAALAVRDALDPLWLEVAGPGGLPEGPGEAAAVAVGLGGEAEEVAEARAYTMTVAAAHDLRALAVADGGALRARLGAFETEPAAAVLRAGTVPAELGALLEAIAGAARSQGVSVRCLAHAANGVVRAALPDGRAVAPLVRQLRPPLEAREGWLVVERAPPAVKAEVDVWGDPGDGRALMRALKETFDPTGVFAPGRFVAGL